MKTASLLCLLIVLSVTLPAQHTLRFEHITNRQGLSQSQAYCILQDSYGYLWVGTQDGLNRFDGKEFKVFKNDPFDSTTLTHNWIWSLAEDSHGDMWIGTFQGLCKYVRKEDRFIQYFQTPHDSTSIVGNRTNNVIRDKKGRLWISSWGMGLNLYDEKTNTFQQFTHDDDNLRSLSDNLIRTLFCDSKGNIWVGTWNGGLNRIVEDEKGFHFQRFYSREENSHLGGNQITSIGEDKEGNIWIGSYGAGLIQLNKVTNSFQRVPNFLQNDVNKIFCDDTGNLWIGTNNGLHHYDAATHSFQLFTHHPNDNTSISSNTIYAITQDKHGLVWIAANGLDKYDPHKNIFQSYRNLPDEKNTLSDNVVWAFCEDDEKNVWIGGENGPISIFNPQTKEFKSLTIHDDKGNLLVNVNRLAFDKGVFWIGSYNTGLVRYDKYTGQSRFYHGSHASILRKMTFIKEVIKDRDGYLWIGSYDQGLVRLDPRTDEAKHFAYVKNDSTSIGSDYINSLMLDKQDNLWIGFLGGGISVLNKKTQLFTHYRYDRKNKNGLSDQMVSSVLQQNDSIFWICTHSGINRLNVLTGKFNHFFEKDGLANNVTYEALMDDSDNLWISTNSGLSKFNLTTQTFRTYTAEDGLADNEFNANAAYKTSSGELYFGTVNGFSHFNPKRIYENKVAPDLHLESFSIFDKVFRPQQNLTFDHTQNYFTFSFSALEFSSPEKIKYAYKLEGVDKEWSEAAAQRSAHYTNLDPGRYTFHVKAVNPDGYWTEPGTTMSFVIRPPFWKTWWFVAMAIILIAAVMYAIHRYRLEQSLKVERLRNKIASDLHDEVGSSLTRISIYSDLVRNGSEEEESKDYLKGISELSREVVLTMSDIVWSIDNRYDTMEALILRMKDFATDVLQARNVTLDFQTTKIDNSRILDPVLKQNLYLIFKEAINNIVKHAQATRVDVLLSMERGDFQMRIRDNGKGLPLNGSPKGNGLRNMNRRAHAIQGEFTMKTDQGTLLVLRKRGF